MHQVIRLTKEDYNDLLDFLNSSFGYKRENGFENLLPAMWHNTDESMGKHLAIKENDHIVAAMGIYPLQVHVGEQDLLFATTGNIAVSPTYRNQGLMQLLMEAVFEELERLDVDVARLGGDRLRYNRYGYEYAGNATNYVLTAKNAQSITTTSCVFRPLEANDTMAMAAVKRWHQAITVYVERGNSQNYYDCMTAFKSTPFIAREDSGQPIGCITVSPEKATVYECYADTAPMQLKLLAAWLTQNSLHRLHFTVAPWETALGRLAGTVCEQATVGFATQCRIRNWDKVINAYLSLKPKTVTEDTFVLQIDNGDPLEIGRNGCIRTDKTPDLTLDRLTATRLLFGHQRPDHICTLPANKAAVICALLPLPFDWNNQDRV